MRSSPQAHDDWKWTVHSLKGSQGTRQWKCDRFPSKMNNPMIHVFCKQFQQGFVLFVVTLLRLSIRLLTTHLVPSSVDCFLQAVSLFFPSLSRVSQPIRRLFLREAAGKHSRCIWQLIAAYIVLLFYRPLQSGRVQMHRTQNVCCVLNVLIMRRQRKSLLTEEAQRNQACSYQNAQHHQPHCSINEDH